MPLWVLEKTAFGQDNNKQLVSCQRAREQHPGCTGMMFLHLLTLHTWRR